MKTLPFVVALLAGQVVEIKSGHGEPHPETEKPIEACYVVQSITTVINTVATIEVADIIDAEKIWE
jgi:hypothetical protein